MSLQPLIEQWFLSLNDHNHKLSNNLYMQVYDNINLNTSFEKQ